MVMVWKTTFGSISNDLLAKGAEKLILENLQSADEEMDAPQQKK